MVGRSKRMKTALDATLRDAVDRMEPDLRLLKGTAMILQALSESADAVDPVAIEAIAHLAHQTTTRLECSWREARDGLR